MLTHHNHISGVHPLYYQQSNVSTSTANSARSPIPVAGSAQHYQQQQPPQQQRPQQYWVASSAAFRTQPIQKVQSTYHMMPPQNQQQQPQDCYYTQQQQQQQQQAAYIPYYAHPSNNAIIIDDFQSNDIRRQLFPGQPPSSSTLIPPFVPASSSYSNHSDESVVDALPSRQYVHPVSMRGRQLPSPPQHHQSVGRNVGNAPIVIQESPAQHHQRQQQGKVTRHAAAAGINMVPAISTAAVTGKRSRGGVAAEVIDLTMDTPEPVVKRRRVDKQAVGAPIMLTPVSAKASSFKDSEQHQDDENGYLIVKINDSIRNGRYKVLKVRGQGTFGRVVEAWDRERKVHVAIKIIRSQAKFKNAARGEVKILKHVQARDPSNKKQCIHLLEDFFIGDHMCMVFNLLGGSLYDCMRASRFSPFATHQIRELARQILEATAFLHSEKITHTDLKPENLMLDCKEFELQPLSKRTTATQIVLRDTRLTVIDMGSAVFHDDYHSSVVATRHYRAPEIILGTGWSYPCDIFAIGCILAELFTGSVLVPTVDETTHEEHLFMLEAILGKFPTRMVNSSPTFFPRGRVDYPKNDTRHERYMDVKALPRLEKTFRPRDQAERLLLDLVKKMLDLDPQARPTASEALRHPFLAEK
ncbi:hypothetical protein SmJEL517_g00748 [Synchytrium microbalum]|uniref:Protein kinase domain-containing protein n=1 Tax=Synchytrium microbalum TaxID=1806994 RepID=A0A507CE34_9FUNG|nr:uncharacterized protein SmJEL517_g00748 [Synchytrium microbalum]TPX37439.1 hypothetical protein SmJEL517_g00748 [Synchytrium microbalum]